MNDAFVSCEVLKADLKRIEELRIDLIRTFSLLSQDIRYIFSKIKSCETFEDAKYYLDLLSTIQEGLSVFVFEGEIGVPDRLDNFVREYDRYVREPHTYFEKIKKGESVF